MAVIHTEQFLEQIQSSYQFTDLEMKRLKYTLKAVSSELVKTLVLSVLFFKLGHLPEFLIGVLVLVTIRCNSGGLHMEHFITCFLFTLIFMLLSVIVLPACVSVPHAVKPVILALCILITFLAAPIASKKRPPAAPETKRQYRNRATGLLFIYSVVIIILKTTPMAGICFWIIVLQTLQLLCAVAAQKGGKNEKIQ
ncbi:MAG: accessory gene regulator B family protein [Eubacterium sp.]|nr:accessory gene regulator B family protein [Eubacterium sp.]